MIGLAAASVAPGSRVTAAPLPVSSDALQAMDGQGDYAPGELIIGLGARPEETLRESVKNWGGAIVGELPEIHAFLIRLGEPTISSLYQRSALAEFEYVERNNYVHSTFAPNDPLWPSQWGPHIVRADLAWDVELGDRSVIVAVIDTGIDYHHEDLAGNYLSSGYDWVNHDSDPQDDNGHGTHVAGIVGAVTNNGVGIAGLSQVSIMAEKVLDSSGTGTVFDAAQGVIDAAGKGARITNNSYGTYSFSSVLRDAFEYAFQVRGVLSVAAAGNDNIEQLFYPAAFGQYVVSVAGTDQNDNKASFSNHGDWIELSAPAVDILSTLSGQSYGNKTGTSMASAIVAGVAALVWSHSETMSAEQVRERLRQTTINLDDRKPSPFFGYGRVDAFSALRSPTHVSAPVGGVVVEPPKEKLQALESGSSTVTMAVIGIVSVALFACLNIRFRKHNKEA
jgi:subtilisin family serine protease